MHALSHIGIIIINHWNYIIHADCRLKFLGASVCACGQFYNLLTIRNLSSLKIIYFSLCFWCFFSFFGEGFCDCIPIVCFLIFSNSIHVSLSPVPFVIISRYTRTHTVTLTNISVCSLVLAHAHLLSTNVISCAEILRPGISYIIWLKNRTLCNRTLVHTQIFLYELNRIEWEQENARERHILHQHTAHSSNSIRTLILANQLDQWHLQHSNRLSSEDSLYFIYFGAITRTKRQNECECDLYENSYRGWDWQIKIIIGNLK